MRKFFLALLLAACSTGGSQTRPSPQPPAPIVHLTADGQTQTLHSTLTSPLALIASTGLALNSGDLVVMNGVLLDPGADPPPAPPRALMILRAQALTVVEDGSAIPVRVA
ncbi:MAG: hypothetical protein ACT4QE_13955, partial [Anaerolineales bacterium]